MTNNKRKLMQYVPFGVLFAVIFIFLRVLDVPRIANNNLQLSMDVATFISVVLAMGTFLICDRLMEQDKVSRRNEELILDAIKRSNILICTEIDDAALLAKQLVDLIDKYKYSQKDEKKQIETAIRKIYKDIIIRHDILSDKFTSQFDAIIQINLNNNVVLGNELSNIKEKFRKILIITRIYIKYYIELTINEKNTRHIHSVIKLLTSCSERVNFIKKQICMKLFVNMHKIA